jgi:two-component system, cell cycle response regulator
MSIKILTVDDSRTIRLIVGRAFKTYDCEVMEAANGVEGLAVASREKPDVIILDVTMPVMDGTEMLSRLKSTADLKSIPVIMLTAEAGRENVLRIARMGVRDYLVKPFKEDQIVERVSRIVELKNRGGTTAKSKKRFDDPLKIVLADDKTAIWDQFKAGLSDTPWQIDGFAQAQSALENIGSHVPDLIFVSTSLPDGAGFWLFQKLRSSVKTEKLPIFALSVKTAVDDQARAQQVGFTGIVTKPIDFADLKMKITRVLGLDASYKYYEQKSGALVVNYPSNYTQSIANDMAAHLQEKVTEAVDAGLDKLVVDLTQLKSVDMPLIEQVLNVMKYAGELSLKSGVIGSDEVRQACTNFEETKEWLLAGSLDDIMKLM